MFKTIKNFFTKMVQLTSDVFQPSEIVAKEPIHQDSFVSSEIIEEGILEKKIGPKIKEIKYRKIASYR